MYHDKLEQKVLRIAERIQTMADKEAIACGHKPARPPEYWAFRLLKDPSIAVTADEAHEYLSGCKAMKSIDLGWAVLYTGIGMCGENFFVTIAKNGNATICSDMTDRK